ncbi:hypothetical protein CLG96_00290 [Sphingomonas oleivorans]|uniref:Activator of Hsp90 ATPase homologue 1/2-like C-terminal domain-containing protein n=1 Tax=Sphingomonas oleivorans TaxID=1735121 RepID=A0A2T5G0H7_9SPHN|nr:SRPBCC domain-containing protein [Sphingomonas oleivorans]PTQ12649.1 hypothetical protein CLG96_00290 [Sphingomonas oleivorans]
MILARESNPEREVVITRLIDVPRERLFRAWTDPVHLMKWWGPHGFTVPVCELDLRPGGAYRIVMRGPDGTDYPVKGVYREIAPPERLVMTDNCSELPEQWHDQLNPGRDRVAGRPALETLSTVIFEQQGERTKLTIRSLFKSASLRDAMVGMGRIEGWTESLEKLESLLAPEKAA